MYKYAKVRLTTKFLLVIRWAWYHKSTFTFFFLSPPNSKCLHRLIGNCFLYLHCVHSIFNTIFFVVFACSNMAILQLKKTWLRLYRVRYPPLWDEPKRPCCLKCAHTCLFAWCACALIHNWVQPASAQKKKLPFEICCLFALPVLVRMLKKKKKKKKKNAPWDLT